MLRVDPERRCFACLKGQGSALPNGQFNFFDFCYFSKINYAPIFFCPDLGKSLPRLLKAVVEGNQG